MVKLASYTTRIALLKGIFGSFGASFGSWVSLGFLRLDYKGPLEVSRHANPAAYPWSRACHAGG